MSNPFDREDGQFIVLVNEAGQHSLWPEFVEAPAGWRLALAATDRTSCLRYVAMNWTDLRPRGAGYDQGAA